MVETPEEPRAPTGSMAKRMAMTVVLAIGAGVGAASARAAVRQKRTRRSARRTKRSEGVATVSRPHETSTPLSTLLDPPVGDHFADTPPMAEDADLDEDLSALLDDDGDLTNAGSASAPGSRTGRRLRRRDGAR